ncbi:hydrogenase expression/formation protein HypE [Oceanidesulfovibrio indonesiensis]|uniref:Hydrogenase expression/formation protein HypE n=1 Tax=Oceanidesulfovibrio indonesiensis TaxID=54767 RepID=A0A7M3MFT1_9BACT|nr:hydrogenase expression/formation protein HypE [Oceanidesulfovibrio indonesiensis]TVM17640.1 hydrogenase expression/formation protein HypE [Oceanidesulfovibrio indonesiensis]
MDKLLLDAGSGGLASHRLVAELFLKHFDNPVLAAMNDAAFLEGDAEGRPLAMSTDAYTVDPPEFPGGDIGSLAIHGTVNDVAMLGAEPRWITCAFILEEGLDMAFLERVVRSMDKAARDAGVIIAAGDTKVVPRGAVDRIFITTTGVGPVLVDPAPMGHRAAPGDVVLLSGSVGDHGLTVLGTREGLSFQADVQSDSAALNHIVKDLVTELPEVHVLRDPTRGGLATTLNEIAGQSSAVIRVEEKAIPISPAVASGCSFLGLDPLYLANEGKLLCILPGQYAEAALEIMRRHEAGAGAVRIGQVEDPDGATYGRAGQVVLTTTLGGSRLLSMLEGEQLPRIC